MNKNSESVNLAVFLFGDIFRGVFVGDHGEEEKMRHIFGGRVLVDNGDTCPIIGCADGNPVLNRKRAAGEPGSRYDCRKITGADACVYIGEDTEDLIRRVRSHPVILVASLGDIESEIGLFLCF